MERLTDIINGWTFEETIKTAESLMEVEKNMFKWDVLRHLRDFAENYREQIKEFQHLEEQDRLVKLPCKVGDTLYWINGKFIINYKITGFSVDEDGVWIMHAEHCVKTVNKTYLYNIAVDTIGETAFFSESEAEAKLKELRNNND